MDKRFRSLVFLSILFGIEQISSFQRTEEQKVQTSNGTKTMTIYVVMNKNQTGPEYTRILNTLISSCAQKAHSRAKRSPWGRSARRRSHRNNGYHRPHRPVYHPQSRNDNSLKQLIFGIVPAFLTVGGLLGFGLSALFFDQEPDNSITFNPNISYNGDNITFTVTDTDTISNSNSQSQTASSTNTISNTDTNDFDTTFEQVVINTEGAMKSERKKDTYIFC